ncbi:hypothetical protein A3H10_00845 [Candidatus Uhrbacteria bacterium RIFCSPLOWO2_12_FULL_46_10]|uniref:Metallopeptidase family protein n=1 Tax=Candidatus Uhrbacteria bacterium RIFCSPLOWO2_01_FULL_47_25 TaxID=1802402 RepID=A0A1F7URY0_9BACT|nr:MAG: hypothetical protein A2752_00155 [Candidatus Uhrbacteria bacterium RIFCSPHIGHO2_01_FULL_46_23]OGL68366.1 MAG: hypothetical protein A3D60_00655 [Candidatus Uhrbacteria bacterium RIFCSPHIGHO2_02_FULL_47_29]OGL75051.1 MAG: hypothetical protein A3E96_00270 [Candidatus Uhrbacteria bacterium RIFCSPHIGHO2_12_FULL_46_13]OGL81053.1 MAG: hypothetical protein A2936_00455 [Candidatus Uhrbacteria bacterium RIFCSPLOWO2_01_FULL_47_25]OGL90679.1 MAG: hypothetical protein A3H10_00845 [Candidatus Uhrbact
MTREEFEKLTEEALDEIPEKFHKLMDNVVILVEDNARPEHGQEIGIRKNEVLLGLYQGVPQTHRGPHYSMVPPDRITIFQNTIEKFGRTPAGIRQLVKDTIWHEIAHHFGSDERRVRKAEVHRRHRST